MVSLICGDLGYPMTGRFAAELHSRNGRER